MQAQLAIMAVYSDYNASDFFMEMETCLVFAISWCDTAFARFSIREINNFRRHCRSRKTRIEVLVFDANGIAKDGPQIGEHFAKILYIGGD